MNPTTITLTHANLHTQVDIAVTQMAFWYYSKGSECVHVVASGGAIFPAKETREEITRLYNAALAAQPKEDVK